MSCLLPLIFGVCLVDPSSLTLVGQASSQVAGDFQYANGGRSFGGAHVGRAAIQLETQLSSTIKLTYGFEHMSLLDTDEDRGQERFFMGFEWRPFSR